jgi:uncharacterized protein
MKRSRDAVGVANRVVGCTLAWCLPLAMAATPPASAEPVRSLMEMREESVVLQEWDLSCGAASLATLLRYQHGDAVTEKDVALGLINRPAYIEAPDLVRIREGFSLFDLDRFAESRGFVGRGLGGLALADLVRRAPALVPIRTHGYNHFVIFRGQQGNRVLLADPAFGNRTMTVERFERVWIEYPEIGHVAFIVENPAGTSAANRLAPHPELFPTFN